jgi:hypothetical protein
LLSYTIDYRLMGNEIARSVVITDHIPPSTTVDWIGDGGTRVGDVVSWNIGDLAPGASGSVHFRVQVETPLPNGIHIYNTASMSDANGGRAIASEDTMVHAEHVLSVSKSDSPDPVEANSLLTYTIHYRVTGNEPAPNVAILDDVPVDTVLVDAPGGTLGIRSARWDLGGLVPGDEGDVVMVVRTGELLLDGTVINNQATIADDDGASATSLVQRTTVQSSHELHLEKHDTATGPVGAGGELVYSIHYSVTGQEIAQGVAITDDIPVSTTYVSCDGGTVCSPVDDRVTWIVGDVFPGEGGAVTLTLQVDSPLPDGTVITNAATVRDDNGGAPVRAEEETTVAAQTSVRLPLILKSYVPVVEPPGLPDLMVTGIAVAPEGLVAGQAADIVVTVVNTGTRAPDRCFWIDLYVNPKLLPIVVNKGWFQAQSDAGLVWSLCGLEPGESVTIRYGDENYWADMSNFAGSFAEPGTYTLYAQVDSWNPGVAWGAVFESDEENNVYGPHSLEVGSSEASSGF